MSIALEIQATTDVTRAVAGLDDVADSARSMGDAVAAAGRDVAGAESKLTRTADAADTLDSKASQATGGLGALAAGFELAGADGYAEKLGQAAMATDFLSGVGAIANLVLATEGGLRAKAAAQAVVHTAATVAQSAASKAAAATTWLLNAALAANPIGLVVLAVVALVAGIVLLYKKSDTFRELIQKVGEVGQRAIGWVVDAAADLLKWIKDKLPGGLGTLREVAVRVFRLITTPQRIMLGVIVDIAQWLREKVPGALQTLREKVSGIADKLLAPFRALKEFLDGILQTIHDISREGGGMRNGASGAADYFTDNAPGAGNGPQRGDSNHPNGRTVSTTVNVQGVVDERTVRQITTAQRNLLRRGGAQ